MKKTGIVLLLLFLAGPLAAADWLQPPNRVAAEGSGWRGKLLGESWSAGLLGGYMFLSSHSNPVDGSGEWLNNPSPDLGRQFGVRGRIFFGRIGIGLSILQIEETRTGDASGWESGVNSDYYQYYYYLYNENYEVHLLRFLIEPMLLYRWPVKAGVQLYAGIGPVWQLVDWSVVDYGNSGNDKIIDQMNGSFSSPGFALRGGGELFLSSWVSLSVELNFRYWGSELKDEKFSGLSVQCGLDFWL